MSSKFKGHFPQRKSNNQQNHNKSNRGKPAKKLQQLAKTTTPTTTTTDKKAATNVTTSNAVATKKLVERHENVQLATAVEEKNHFEKLVELHENVEQVTDAEVKNVSIATDNTDTVANVLLIMETIVTEVAPTKISYTIDELLEIQKNMPKQRLSLDQKRQLKRILRLNDFLPEFAKRQMQVITTHQHRVRRSNRRANNSPSLRLSTEDMKPNIIVINISLKSSVKLNETENAWKPKTHKRRFDREKPPLDVDLEAAEREQFFSKIRSILNKLTEQNFAKLLEQVKLLRINSLEKLNGVILLVFEKAIAEPNFATLYAKLCHELSFNFCPDHCSAGENQNFSSFKRTIVSKCQQEFENNVMNGKAIHEKLKPLQAELSECVDDLKKREFHENLVQVERDIRRRIVCTVRFIGELFKMNLMTSTIMRFCIVTLLECRSEETYECLCKLLTTVGHKLETKTADEKLNTKLVDLTEYFDRLKHICDSKANNKISNRIRFMILDLIDLRANKWISKRK